MSEHPKPLSGELRSGAPRTVRLAGRDGEGFVYQQLVNIEGELHVVTRSRQPGDRHPEVTTVQHVVEAVIASPAGSSFDKHVLCYEDGSNARSVNPDELARLDLEI